MFFRIIFHYIKCRMQRKMPYTQIIHRFFICFLFLCMVAISVDGKQFNRRNIAKNFINVKFTNESVRELRIAFRGYLMMETSAFQNSEFELHLKQITDGRRLVQSVYQNGVLRDCDFEKNSQVILQFVEKFASIFENESRKENKMNVFELYDKKDGTVGNKAFKYFRNRKALGKFRKLVKLRHDLKACHRLTNNIRRKHLHERADSIKSKTISFTHRLIKLKKKIREELRSAMDNANTTETSKKPEAFQNSQHESVPHHLAETSAQNARLKRDLGLGTHYDKIIKSKHSRPKRSCLFHRFLMYPGTKWCGKGQTAVHYDDLGTDREADVCCRDHDLCPHIIESFSYKFGMFNYRIHALLHCKCDKRFRECLQQSVSPTAKFIGEIYFNIMGTKCFEFEYEKVCTVRSWWGSCLQTEKKKTAHVKEQKTFGYY